MNTIMSGKTMMLWQVKSVLKGNPDAIADNLVNLGCTSLQVKAANGVSAYNLELTATGYKDTLIGPLADALEQRAIELWGWHYIYGNEPEREAQRAAERISAYPFKGWIIDVEKEFKISDSASRARRFMTTFRNLAPDVKLGFCSYRYPSLHREVPYQEFLSGSDFVMPQVYWVRSNNPAEQLARTVDEYKALYTKYGINELPMIPVGAAYKEWGWQATAGQVTEFMDAAKNTKLQAVSFWRHAHVISLGLDQAISDFDWPTEPVDPPPPPDNTLESRVCQLENRVADLEDALENHLRTPHGAG